MLKTLSFKITCLLILGISQFSQAQNNDAQLANEYYGQGEYDKAKNLYQELAEDWSNIPLIHNNYFFLLLETADFKSAEKYINRLIKKFPNNIYYYLDRGILFLKEGSNEKADNYFKSLINDIKLDNYRIRITADYFVKNQLSEYAIFAFQEARSAINNPFAYSLEMANIYRLMNEKDLMVEEYLNYVSQNPSNLNYVKNTLQNLLTEPGELESLEAILLDKVQKNPDSEIYPELLIWANLQQKNFYAAFIQARAIDRRLQTEGSRTINIGLIALDNEDYNTANQIFQYVIDKYKGSYNYILASIYQIKTKEKQVRNSYPVNNEDIRKLVNDYAELIEELGMNRNTIDALRNKALLHAFYLDEKDSAISILQSIIDTPRANQDIKAKSKLDLGDIYLLEGTPWESTLLYSQVEKSNKEEYLGYEAKLKNAKLSYYKGDFKLAQEHLDILKEATSREISNNAMELSILIKDNIALDSTETAMRKYAAIDLLLFQNKTEEALEEIDKMLNNYNGHSLTDELLWLKADILKKAGEFETAYDLYKRIVENYDYDILSDDAYFMMGDLQEKYLSNKEKAKEIYREFLTRYPGSVYVAEARKRFRMLRGDFQDEEKRIVN